MKWRKVEFGQQRVDAVPVGGRSESVARKLAVSIWKV
jgi:hypothetical protein